MAISTPGLLAAARLGFSEPASIEAMLWENLDLDDPDDRRFGDYELLERIGRGGMGVVFRARQLSLEREVAVKFIVGSLADNAQAVARFLGEARAAARLHHPHIVPVFEVDTVDGMHFFSMPLLRGQTLAQRIATERLTTTDCVDLLIKLGSAVEYAHSLGLLHLDLKPGNVLFDEHGQPLIGDFGLARHTDAAGGVDVQDVSGTPEYMAPEQRAAGSHRLNACTDVYALGAILRELLASNAAGAVNDRDLDAVCRKCQREDPGERYQNVSALNADLARFRDGNDVSARIPARRERALRSVRRHPAITLATVAALTVLLIGLATTSWQWRRAEAARAEATVQQGLAKAQALRMQQLAGLMAAVFPAGDGAFDERASSARNAVAWLKQHVPNDPVAQRDVLSAFRRALTADGKADVVAVLMTEIANQFGEDYRQAQVARLAKKGDRDSLIAAALIGMPRGADGASSAAHAAVLQRLLEDHPNDELALYVVALACHVQSRPCLHPEYFARLTERFPGNAAHWVLVPSGANPTDRELAAHVLQAAGAHEFDDRGVAFAGLLRAALRNQDVPESILEPMQAVLSESEVAPLLRRNAVHSAPMPFYRDVMLVCTPASIALLKVAGLRDACGAFAKMGMRSPGTSTIARMVSSAMLRRLYKGTPLEAEAFEYRRQYVWLSEQVLPDSGSSEPINAEQIQQDVSRYGEWEAWQRQADRMGKPRTPPPGWQPAKSQTLLLAEDRTPAAPKR